ncbi:C-C chemokine receptor-like 2 [Suricata suricatta]|uniref:Chemokine C-C motif receptor-like 2 n=1 Tax=Suricata suricatta TaxID=37032 RepID=A0A673U0N8_SURSU|nr:C-C chemokine receptor-like 2 [Suricata suricatta]XP_029773607.1 C-C chemokine receptor-like 2 [Suricata suricatta]XP_029773608.1 C-C chemokine receptor-like 2 [Suricata suricatta]XP_029773609.1 C-C chemokine receptor-like 2 [Suricata suricatta]XP_029773610.1 C-C chemokine receptor-like 2 [Suricata suricatta]XP_029773611.1 C-C chemokine receptor-like 2 [Suricata suricatta]XP_029773612.1 C-C chemokine receptor-like 2 [Suricata suricatta]XP_029773613.1 C-C chemokine receptor-like 2 [Suricat
MTNYTWAPDDNYDVLIEGDLSSDDTETCQPFDGKLLSSRVVPLLFSLVCLAGLLGNSLVVLILVKYKGLGCRANVYFLNLAVSNLCSLLSLPFWAYTASHGGVLGNPTCMVLLVFSSIGLYSEAFLNVLLTLQRYLVFFNMRTFFHMRMEHWVVVSSGLAWVLATLVILPELVSYKPQTESRKFECFISRPHFLPVYETSWEPYPTLKMNILALLFPLCVLTFCYTRLRETLRCRGRERDPHKLVFVIVVVFLLMWGPYNIALFLSTFKEHFPLHDCRSSYHLDASVQISRIVAATHCCVNPLLHVVLNTEFQRHLCRLCHLRRDRPLRATEDPAREASVEERDHSTKV